MFMKRAVNIRLDENVVITLDYLSRELKTTKTDIIERAIQLFSKEKQKSNNELLAFAGVLDETTSESFLSAIHDKKSKDFSLDL
jgi:predicted transcriptional regulator